MTTDKIVWTSQTTGRCETTRKREDYDWCVLEFGKFLSISQFFGEPEHIDKLKEWLEGPKASKTWAEVMEKAKIYSGHKLYGVNSDGSLVKIAEWIDSSD